MSRRYRGAEPAKRTAMRGIRHALIAMAAIAAPSAAALPKGPDFSAVTDRIKAGALVRQHRLEKIFYISPELNGRKSPVNTGYVTPEAAQAWALLTGTLIRFNREGLADHVNIRPDYRGHSIVPTRIVLKATSKKGGPPFEATVEVW